MLHEDNRPLKGEGRLTDEVLRAKLRRGKGPILGVHHDEPNPHVTPRPTQRPR